MSIPGNVIGRRMIGLPIACRAISPSTSCS